MSKKLLMINLLFVILIVFLVFILYPLDPQPSMMKENETKISLRITTMFAGTDPATIVYENALQEFMESYPNVKIIDESLPAGDMFRRKVKTDFAAGNEADVTFFFTGMDAYTLISTGRVLPFDSFLEEDLEWKNGFSKTVLNEVRHTDGLLYALPVTGFYEGLFCNQDLFDKFHVPLPTTWENLLYAIEVFSNQNIIPIAASLDESYYLIDAFLLSAGGTGKRLSQLNEETIPYWVLGLEHMKKIYEQNGFPSDCFTIKDMEAQQLFINKDAAMMVNGSWVLPTIKDKVHTIIMPFPIVPHGLADPTDIIGGNTSGYFLSKRSHEDPQKQQLALTLIHFLTQPEMIDRFAALNYGIPATTVPLSSPCPLVQEGYKMTQNAAHLIKPIDFDMHPEAFLEIRKNLPFIMKSQRSPQEILNEIAQTYTGTEKIENED